MATPRKPSAKRDAAKSKAVAQRDFANALRKLPDEYIECRDMAHSYYVSHDFHVAPDTVVGGNAVLIDRVFSCRRCPRTRTQHFKQGRYGLEKLGESTWSPTDYTIPGVPRGVRTKIIVQQEAYRRAMEKATGVAKGQRATGER